MILNGLGSPTISSSSINPQKCENWWPETVQRLDGEYVLYKNTNCLLPTMEPFCTYFYNIFKEITSKDISNNKNSTANIPTMVYNTLPKMIRTLTQTKNNKALSSTQVILKNTFQNIFSKITSITQTKYDGISSTTSQHTMDMYLCDDDSVGLNNAPTYGDIFTENKSSNNLIVQKKDIIEDQKEDKWITLNGEVVQKREIELEQNEEKEIPLNQEKVHQQDTIQDKEMTQEHKTHNQEMDLVDDTLLKEVRCTPKDTVLPTHIFGCLLVRCG